MTNRINQELIIARQKYLEMLDGLREAEDKAEYARSKLNKAEAEYENILRQFDQRYSK